jgi:FkbM family methyltransferase
MGYTDVNFSKYIRNHNDPVILDIGSYNGRDAILFKHRFPNGKVYAIEASSNNMNTYMRDVPSYGVEVRHLAMGEVNEIIRFFPSLTPGIDGSGSILNPTAKGRENVLYGEEVVMCMTIEKFCEQEKLDRIDCIHIDAQGADRRILEHIGPYRPDCIFAETCAYDEYENSGSIELMDAYMKSIGYRMEMRKYSPDGVYIWDSFYVREDL